MDILQNELVRKYFICPLPDGYVETPMRRCMCLPEHIIEAMQQPIAKGDKVLGYTLVSWGVIEVRDDTYIGNMQYHPSLLRLPDRWQKKNKCVYKCHDKECNCSKLYPQFRHE